MKGLRKCMSVNRKLSDNVESKWNMQQRFDYICFQINYVNEEKERGKRKVLGKLLFYMVGVFI